MKMNEFITQLKQQPRIGGVPPRDRSIQRLQDENQVLTTANNGVNEQVRQLAQQLANQIVAEQNQAQLLARNGRTYTKFDAVNDIDCINRAAANCSWRPENDAFYRASI